MGVANKRSIAWGCTQAILDQGAKVILSYQNDRIKKSLERFVPDNLDLVECDVSDDDNVKKAFEASAPSMARLMASFMPSHTQTRIH